MNQRIKIVYGLILLVLYSCSNGDKKSTVENTSSIKKTSGTGIIEDQFGDDVWIERELKKQLSKTQTKDSIEIYGLPIEDLPESIYLYPNIKYLSIGCIDFSCMRSLSSRISEFKNLETLIISKSALTKLPKEIGELSNLKKLTIAGGGQVNSIPVEISKLNKLEELDLWRNSLSEINLDLNAMNNLKTIYLGENNFPKTYIKALIQKHPEINIKMDYVKIE